jgi:hypothetical protein
MAVLTRGTRRCAGHVYYSVMALGRHLLKQTARSIRVRSTRLAGSVRERTTVVKRNKSSSPSVNSNARRHAVMIFHLVQRITNEATARAPHEESPATD